MKKNSKYLGMKSGEWECTDVSLAANYCGSTRHNAYRYQFSRPTSDKKCIKIVTVSAPTLLKILRGFCSVDDVANNKMKMPGNLNHILYKFN